MLIEGHVALYRDGKEIEAADYRRQPATLTFTPGPHRMDVDFTERVAFTLNAAEDWGRIDEWRMLGADGLAAWVEVLSDHRRLYAVQRGSAFVIEPCAHP